MFYSQWAKVNEAKSSLIKSNYKGKVEHSGTPVIYEGNDVYTTRSDAHTLVVGSTGSGKTQTIILPRIKLAMLAEESIVVNDPKGELYSSTAKELENRGYNVIVLDFDNSMYGNYYNPLSLAHNLFKEGNKDKCLSIIEEIGYYIFAENNSNADPFWENSVIDYFSGLCLYLFDKNKEVTLKDVYELGNKLVDVKESEAFLKEIGNNNPIFYSVSGTLKAPTDTKGSIISVFNQKIRLYLSKEKLTEMMSKSDFEIRDIQNEKTAVFIVSGIHSYCNNLIPLFINQVMESVDFYGRNKRINLILDEFDNLKPIKNFEALINISRYNSISMTVVIQSFVNLVNTYGKENYEIIKLCFPNIVYLYATDLFTLEEISKMCGNESDKKSLVSPEELKMLETFEGIFIMPRTMPFKNKLIPDYKIDWNIDFEKAELKPRK